MGFCVFIQEANQEIAINNAILKYHHIHLHGCKVLLVVMNYVTKLGTTRERHIGSVQIDKAN